jgi:hypothetical protein
MSGQYQAHLLGSERVRQNSFDIAFAVIENWHLLWELPLPLAAIEFQIRLHSLRVKLTVRGNPNDFAFFIIILTENSKMAVPRFLVVGDGRRQDAEKRPPWIIFPRRRSNDRTLDAPRSK